MKLNELKTPDFTRLIAELRTRARISDVAAVAIEELLQASLNEYCMVLHGYYEEKYYNAISSARNSAYYDGYDDGYSDGHFEKHLESHYESHSAV